MPQPRLSMRKVKEVFRLHYELRLGQRQIRPLLLDLSEHRPRLLEADRNAGLPWPLPLDWDEAQLEERLFGGRVARPPGHRRAEPGYYSLPYQLVARQSSKDSRKPSSRWNANRVVKASVGADLRSGSSNPKPG